MKISTQQTPNSTVEGFERGFIKQPPPSSESFADYLWKEVKKSDHLNKLSNKKAVKLSLGKTDNIHETMLYAVQAELTFQLMVQIRNKALDAYHEVMRMSV